MLGCCFLLCDCLQALHVSDAASEHCTMPYRSPELFDPAVGSKLDSRTDIWALGCLLFAWWYGYSPFECEFVSPANGASNGSAGQVVGSANGIEMKASYEKLSDDDEPAVSARWQVRHAGKFDLPRQQAYQMKVVPCSHLRILAPPPARVAKVWMCVAT